MTKKLSIANYNNLMRILSICVLFNLFCLTIFISLLGLGIDISGNKKIDFNIWFYLMILSNLILLVFMYRATSKEDIQIIENAIISQRFGEIKFSSIKSYKVSKFRGMETLHIKLKTGLLLVIAPKNSWQSCDQSSDYGIFKQYTLKSMAEENIRRKKLGIPIINRKKSILTLLFVIGLIAIILIAIIAKIIE